MLLLLLLPHPPKRKIPQIKENLLLLVFLLKAYEIGEQTYATFKDERLERDPPAKKFHDPMKTKKLKTFSNMCKKKEVKSSGRVTFLKADRSLFGRIIMMAQGRNLQMEDNLSHPLGPLSWALSTPDGLL